MNNIDAVYILCLDKRRDLWAALEKDIQDVFEVTPIKFIGGQGQMEDLVYDHIDVPALPYGSHKSKHGVLNAYLCHQKIFQRANDLNQNIALFEDDAKFLKKCKNTLNREDVKSRIESDDWDIIYMGHHSHDQRNTKILSSEPFFLLNESHAGRIAGLYAVLINRRFLPTLIHAEKVPNINPDWPYDAAISYMFNFIKGYVISPRIVWVLDGYSYCENNFASYPQLPEDEEEV